MLKKILIVLLSMNPAFAAEDFYPLYLESPTKCAVKNGDQAAKVVLTGFDTWYYGDNYPNSQRKRAFHDAAQAARFLKDWGCTDSLMLFRWAAMARLQGSEDLQKEAWSVILTSLVGLEKNYRPVLDNAYNTLAKMADKHDPALKEFFLKKAIETRTQEKFTIEDQGLLNRISAESIEDQGLLKRISAESIED